MCSCICSPVRLVLLFVFATSQVVVAQTEPWVGKTVYWKDLAVTRSGVSTSDLEKEPLSFPAKVEKVDEDWLWLGFAWVNKSDCLNLDEAIAYYSERVSNDPQSVRARSHRAACLVEMQDWEEAIKDYNVVLQYDPKNASVFAKRAAAKRKLNKHFSANRDLAEAARLDPQFRTAVPTRASEPLPIQQIIDTITPAPVKGVRQGMEYRVREQRSSVVRFNAVEQLESYGAAAAPAIPVLSRLLDDSFEPNMLKLKAIAVLDRLGIAAAPALPALRRATQSSDALLKQAAVTTVTRLEGLLGIADIWKSGNEDRIEAILPETIGLGDQALPMMVDFYQANSTSVRMRQLLVESFLQVRLKSPPASRETVSLEFQLSNIPVDTLAEQGDIGAHLRLREKALKETFGREVDQLMFERIHGNLQVEAIRYLTKSLSEVLEMANRLDTKYYILDRAQAIADALSRQRQNMGASGEDTLDSLLRCYRHPNSDIELKELLTTCMINYLETCPNRFSTTTRLMENAENRKSPQIKKMLFSGASTKFALESEVVNLPELTVVEKVRCGGKSFVFSSDKKYIAVYSRRVIGSLFAGSLGGGGSPGSPVQVYEVSTGVHVADCGITDNQPSFSATGKYLATKSSESIEIWDLAQGKVRQSFPLSDAKWIRFIDDEVLLILESNGLFDYSTGTVRLWNVETGKSIPSALTNGLQFLTLSQDRRRLAAVSYSAPWKIVVMDSSSLEELASFELEPINERDMVARMGVAVFAKFESNNELLQLFQAHLVDEKFQYSQVREFDIPSRRISRTFLRESSVEIGAAENLIRESPQNEMPMPMLAATIPITSISKVRDGVWSIWEWMNSPAPSRRELNWIDFPEDVREMVKQFETEKSIQVQYITQDLVLVQNQHRRVVLDMTNKMVDQDFTYAVQAGQNPQLLSERYVVCLVHDSIFVRDLLSGNQLYRVSAPNVREVIAVDMGKDSYLVLKGTDNQLHIWAVKENTIVEK